MSQYIEFVETGDTGKTKIWEVRHRSEPVTLGVISWYGPWRQYTFWPAFNTVWNTDCLEQITAFIKGQMEARKVRASEERQKEVQEVLDGVKITPEGHKALLHSEEAAKDCCGGRPNMMQYEDGCPTCGCRESGNASFTCGRHDEEARQKAVDAAKRSFLGFHRCPDER